MLYFVLKVNSCGIKSLLSQIIVSQFKNFVVGEGFTPPANLREN